MSRSAHCLNHDKMPRLMRKAVHRAVLRRRLSFCQQGNALIALFSSSDTGRRWFQQFGLPEPEKSKLPNVWSAV
jgi:hypothetical protein